MIPIQVSLPREGGGSYLAAVEGAGGRPVGGRCPAPDLSCAGLLLTGGGDLIQDLPPHLRPFHTQAGQDLVHPIRCREDTLLHRLYGPLFPVNSLHHQAVGRLGEGLRAAAWSEGGVVEAVELPGRPVLGVQFHPERMAFGRRRGDTADGAPLFTHFLSLCRGAV